MTLNESIGRFNVRKTLRFEMKPLAATAENLDAFLAEDKFFVALHVSCNPDLVLAGNRPQPFGNLERFLKENPYAKFVTVAPTDGGYRVDGVFIPTAAADSGGVMRGYQLVDRIFGGTEDELANGVKDTLRRKATRERQVEREMENAAAKAAKPLTML